MTASSQLPAPTLLPLMRYRDLVAAIKWLEEAFAFEKQVAVSDTAGAVIYAQMTFGNGMLMLSSVRETDLDKLMRQPDEVGNIETQSCYIVVDDADAHYARALGAGADIVLDIKSDSFGRRGYSCRDPQGHIWNFGTYSPGKTPAAKNPSASKAAAPRKASRVGALAAVIMAATIGAAWWTGALDTITTTRIAASLPDDMRPDLLQLRQELAKARAEKRAADLTAEQNRRALETEHTERIAAETESEKARQALTEASAARAAVEANATIQRQAAVAGEPAMPPPTNEAVESVKVSPPVEHDAPTAKAEVAPAATAADSTETSSINRETAAPKPASSGQTPSKATSLQQGSKIKRAAQTGKRFKPTYVIEMSDVPWPYDTWYRRKGAAAAPINR